MINTYFNTEYGELFWDDCLYILKQLPNDIVDMTITSPPYDNLRDYKGYSFDFENIAKELFRLTKKGGVVVWIVADATIDGSETGTSFKQALYFKEIGFNLHDTMIWAKTKMPQNHNRYEQGFEYMFILSKGKPKTFNGIKDKRNSEAGTVAHAKYRDKDGIMKNTSSYKKSLIADYGLRTNVWRINPCLTPDERFGHPAPFSEELVHDHIISWSNENDVILDPFMGSGTTAKVSEELKRKWIGIEISNEYCDIIKNRINKWKGQQRLSTWRECSERHSVSINNVVPEEVKQNECPDVIR